MATEFGEVRSPGGSTDVKRGGLTAFFGITGGLGILIGVVLAGQAVGSLDDFDELGYTKVLAWASIAVVPALLGMIVIALAAVIDRLERLIEKG